ncbi:MAG: pilus assembly protein PilP [Coxiellaceae bacterium]|nr:pilus assembly protein PilP [Coxiellaceae bacterium]
MNKTTLATLSIILICTSLITGCSDDSKNKAKKTATQFISELKQRLPFKNKSEDNSKTIPAVTYSANKKQSPFKDIVKDQQKSDVTILLKGTDINKLKLIGIIIQDNKKWAIIEAKDGKMHALTKGFHVGKQNAVVDKITSNSVELSTKSTPNNPYSSIFTLTVQEK